MLQNQSTTLINNQINYEKSLQVSHKKEFGVFLTNNILTVDSILDVIDFENNNILDKTFLEPSCGNGVFVIRLLERIFEKRDDYLIAQKFIENNIYFVDISNEMIEVTKDNIAKYFYLKFGENYNGKFKGFVFDFTQRIKTKGNLIFDEMLNVPLKEYLNKIDFVIGNPPYVSLYGRRDKKKNEEQRVYYLNRYSQFPKTLKNGKINFVMLFIEQSIDFLKENGKLSFIIDLAFFETAYEYTRKYLLDNTKIISIQYNIKDFDVASGQVILKIEKQKVKNHNVKIINEETNDTIYVNQSIWNKINDQYKFRFNMCSKSSAIIDKIHNINCPTLKELYPKKNLRTCVMLLNMENIFVFDNKKDNVDVKIYPYYQGSKGLSGKYERMKNTKFFHYDKQLQDKVNEELKKELVAKGIKNKKRLGLGETIIYDNPKVFIRQSAKEIIASYDEKGSSANNSLYVFSLRDNTLNDKIFLKFITGLLNSDLITFYAQQLNIIRFSKGKQPQIKVSDLYKIPVPKDEKIQLQISELVETIYSKGINEGQYLTEQINKIINDYFKITTKEYELMQNSILDF